MSSVLPAPAHPAADAAATAVGRRPSWLAGLTVPLPAPVPRSRFSAPLGALGVLLSLLPFAWIVGGVLGGAAIATGTHRRSTLGVLLGVFAVLVTAVQAVHTGALSLTG